MPVINNSTGEIATFESDEDLNLGINSGEYGYKGEKQARVYRVGDPGRVGWIPIENIMDAQANGYALESPIRTEIREYAEENADILGISTTFAAEFANSLLFSVPEIVMQNQDDPMIWAKAQALREENTVGALGGDVLGSIGSMFLTPSGPVGTIASKAGVKLLAKRMQASVGKGLSDKMALKSSREILARIGKKTGGNIIARGALGAGLGVQTAGKGMLRGVDEMLPAAAAHSFFGDYNKAGEAIAMGALFGGAIQLPISGVSALGGLAKNIPKGKKNLDAAIGPRVPGETPGQKAAIHAASTVTNLSDDMIRYTVNNIDAVNNAKPFGEMYHKFDELRNRTFERFDQSKLDFDDSISSLKETKKNTTYNMKTIAKGPDEQVANKIEADLDEIESYYGLKSMEADISLDDMIPDRFISTKTIHDDFKREIDFFEDKTSLTADRIARVLTSIKRTVDKKPDLVNGREAREILGDLRKDVDFEQFGKEGRADFELSLASITEGFSEEIKMTPGGQAYAEIMDEMSSKMDATKVFKRSMKDRVARLNTAASLSKPFDRMKATDVKRKEIFGRFLDAMDEIDPSARAEYHALTQAQREANDYLSDLTIKPKEKGLSPDDAFDKKHFPDEYADKQKKFEQWDQDQYLIKKMKPLIGTNSKTDFSEMKLRQFSDENKNVKLNEAFTDFMDYNNTPALRDDLKASLASDSLDKAKINGSRLVKLGSAIGGAILGAAGGVGPLVGGALGAAGGAALDKFSGKILKSISNTNMARSLFAAEDKMAKVANSVDDMPKMGWFVKAGETAKKSMKYSSDALYRSAALTTNDILNENSAEEKENFGITTKTANKDNVINREFNLGVWKTLYRQYTSMEEDPQQLVDKIDIATGQIAEGSPELADAMGQQVATAIGYLTDEMPRPVAPESPYVEKGEEWEPTDYDLDVFNQKVVAAQDPLSVINALYAGEVTKGMVDTLAAIYPSILGMIQSKLAETMAENPDALTYDKKLQAGYVLGVVITPSASPQSMMYYQKVFAEEKLEEQAKQSGKFMPNLKKDPASLQTTSSKLSGGLSSE